MSERKQKILKNKYKKLCEELLLAYRGNLGRKNIQAPEDVEVLALGKRIGFGALMDSASRMWQKQKYGDGAFLCGDCISTVENMIECFDEIKAQDV